MALGDLAGFEGQEFLKYFIEFPVVAQVGPPRGHRVMDGHRAGHLALPARARPSPLKKTPRPIVTVAKARVSEIVVAAQDAALAAMRAHPLGADAAIVGTVIRFRGPSA